LAFLLLLIESGKSFIEEEEVVDKAKPRVIVGRLSPEVGGRPLASNGHGGKPRVPNIRDSRVAEAK